MTPETAKQTIQELLEFGTLQGVKVVYEEENGAQYEVIFFSAPNGDIYSQNMEWKVKEANYYYAFTNIKAIHPIPLQPKLLEVGDIVRVIAGKHKDKTGEIVSTDWHGVYALRANRDGFDVPYFHVIPESLLVEEEVKLYRVLKDLPQTPAGTIVDNFEMTIGRGNGSGIISLEDTEWFEPIDVKALKQAGYKVTKKV